MTYTLGDNSDTTNACPPLEEGNNTDSADKPPGFRKPAKVSLVYQRLTNGHANLENGVFRGNQYPAFFQPPNWKSAIQQAGNLP
jgi:hypothetical protein